MTKTSIAGALLLAVATATVCASAQDATWGPEINTVVPRAVLAPSGSRPDECRVVIANCRRISRTAQICRAGAYLLVDHAAFWERRVRFELVQRELEDGGSVWWGQVDIGGDVLVRLYVTMRDLTVTRVTHFPGEGYTVTVPRAAQSQGPF